MVHSSPGEGARQRVQEGDTARPPARLPVSTCCYSLSSHLPNTTEQLYVLQSQAQLELLFLEISRPFFLEAEATKGAQGKDLEPYSSPSLLS